MARAYYGVQLLPGQLDLMLTWHSADPCDRAKRDRNDTIAGTENTRSPFIDDPNLRLGT